MVWRGVQVEYRTYAKPRFFADFVVVFVIRLDIFTFLQAKIPKSPSKALVLRSF